MVLIIRRTEISDCLVRARVTSRMDTGLLLRILILFVCLFVCLFRVLTNEDANERTHLPCQIQSIDAFKGDR